MNAPQFQWKGDEDESLPDQVNDMQQPVQRFHQQGQGQTQSQKHRFVPIYPTQPSYGNYHMSYVPPANHVANHGAANVLNDSKKDSKLMEKINYMIHLLETQEAEKTANITEEFVLYTFLGVFMIFVLDSFARVGKYTR
jgi:hypothetical protein